MQLLFVDEYWMYYNKFMFHDNCYKKCWLDLYSWLLVLQKCFIRSILSPNPVAKRIPKRPPLSHRYKLVSMPTIFAEQKDHLMMPLIDATLMP